MTTEWKVDHECCRRRRSRLLETMDARGVELAILQQPEHVQWLTGVRFPWLFKTGVALAASGRLTLVAPLEPPAQPSADEIVRYDAKWHSTLRNDQRQAADEALLNAVGRPPSRVGVEGSTFSLHLGLRGVGLDDGPIDIEPDMYRLRRRKEPDELALMARATDATRRMYERAREILRPGVSELTVFSELQAAAVEELGEPLTATGNDYQCRSRGGPPRAGHGAAAGDLYILDLGPAYRGYFADNCRTFAVGEPDERQLEALWHIRQVFAMVEAEVRPGVNARELFHRAQHILDEAPCGVFNHHLGHGVGLFPHEAPHLNPNWDDCFEEGDVFTVEPGLYAPELRAGMRIENNYRVTPSGVALLTEIPIEL